MAGKKHNNVLCLDVGGDSIKAAEFSFSPNGAITLQRFSFQELDFNDIETDNPEFINMVNDKIRNLILSEGYLTKNINVSISGQNAFMRFEKIPAMTNDMDKIQQILDFEAKQNLPFPLNDVVYSTQLMQAEEDDELSAMFVVTKKSEVENTIRNLELIQKHVNLVEVAPTAIYNAAHFNGVGEQQCEMILNIGGRCSTLVFVDNGKYFIRSFLTAGHAITQQIAKEFQIPYKDAEEMKRRHGFVGLGGAYEEPESEVAATVSKIIRNVMTRLHGEIFRTINVYRTQQKGNKPEKLYLTGGSSVMAYTPRFFQEKLRIPVEYLNPFQSIAVAPEVDKESLSQVAHLFPEVVGLAMREAFVCPISIALIPQEQKKMEDFNSKVPYLYASCLALLFCMAISYWVYIKRYEREEDLCSFALNRWKSTEQVQNNVQKEHAALTESQGEYNEAVKMFNGSDYWLKILKAIQQITPKNVWYTEIYAIPTASKTNDPKPAAGAGEFQGFGGGFNSPSSGTTTSAAAGNRDKSDLCYLVIRGHILVQKMAEADRGLHQQIFKKLRESLEVLDLEPPVSSGKKTPGKKEAPVRPLFDKFTQLDINRMEQNFMPAPKGSNISTFSFELKLKEPIKR